MHTTATALKNGWRAVELQNLLSAFPLRCRFFICQTQAFRCAFVFSFASPIPSAALSFFHLPDPGLSLRFRFFICQTHPLSLRFRFLICQTHPLSLRFRFFIFEFARPTDRTLPPHPTHPPVPTLFRSLRALFASR
jgi:hypothetical protein